MGENSTALGAAAPPKGSDRSDGLFLRKKQTAKLWKEESLKFWSDVSCSMGEASITQGCPRRRFGKKFDKTPHEHNPFYVSFKQ